MNRLEFVRYGSLSVIPLAEEEVGERFFFQEEDISKLVECMALNSASSSEEEESEASEVSENQTKRKKSYLLNTQWDRVWP